METKIKKLPHSQIEIEVKLEDKEFQAYYQPIYDEAISKVDIKGFRKGTAPKEMADAAVDKEKVFQSALEEAVRFSLDEVKQKNEWTLIEQPTIEVTNAGPGLTYKATLTLFPEVDLPDYKKIAKKILSQEIKVEVSDEELKKTTEWILNSRASETRVSRGSKISDLLEIDLEALSEGKTIPNSSFKNERFVLGDSKFIEGFDKELIGKKEADEFSFKITAPKDYWQKDLAGKELEFVGKIHGVFEREVPELNDELAKSLGPNFKTVNDLKKSMKEGIELEKRNKEVEKLRIQVLKEITENAKMDIPQILVEKTLDGLVAEMSQSIKPEEGKDPDSLKGELREQLRKRAEENVASHLVVYKMARLEGLEPTKEEVSAQATLHNLDPEKHGGYLYDTIQTQKVFGFLENQEKPKEDPAKDFARVEEEEKKEDNKKDDKEN